MGVPTLQDSCANQLVQLELLTGSTTTNGSEIQWARLPAGLLGHLWERLEKAVRARAMSLARAGIPKENALWATERERLERGNFAMLMQSYLGEWDDKKQALRCYKQGLFSSAV